jgi:hypothetical protein
MTFRELAAGNPVHPKSLSAPNGSGMTAQEDDAARPVQ